MASSTKKRTTMAKLNREQAVRDRRLRKEARKAARKLAATNPPSPPSEAPAGDDADRTSADG
jgi:hypothetical protein